MSASAAQMTNFIKNLTTPCKNNKKLEQLERCKVIRNSNEDGWVIPLSV